MAQIFISYSRKDGEFVHRLDEELRRRGRQAWVDWEGIRALENWEETIYPANIEGRCHDGREEFRAVWKKLPMQSAFESHHGITKQQFEDRRNALREQGYSLEFSAEFQDCNDVTRIPSNLAEKELNGPPETQYFPGSC